VLARERPPRRSDRSRWARPPSCTETCWSRQRLIEVED
jgi:hypothetical protein